MPRVLGVLAALLLLATLPAAASARELTVVLANIGNVNVPGCNDQVFKLCLRPVEERATQALRALKPDITALIEVLPPDLCVRAPSTNPQNLCSGPLEPASQVERLLGAGVPWACDARYGWDCLAVRAAGGLAFRGPLDTRPLPESCSDDGFTVNVGTVHVSGWPVTVTVAHPNSSAEECRADQVRDLFDHGLPAAGPAIVMGDFNLDPYRESDASVEVFKAAAKGFTYASGETITSVPSAPSQTDPSGTTLDNDLALNPPGALGQRTIDHVLVRDGVRGRCEVQRVDGGGGMDHRAQVCALDFTPPKLSVRRSGCSVLAALRPAPRWVTGVRFSLGGRTVTDSARPYAARLRGKGRVTVRALAANGPGPVLRRQIRRC